MTAAIDDIRCTVQWSAQADGGFGAFMRRFADGETAGARVARIRTAWSDGGDITDSTQMNVSVEV